METHYCRNLELNSRNLSLQLIVPTNYLILKIMAMFQRMNSCTFVLTWIFHSQKKSLKSYLEVFASNVLKKPLQMINKIKLQISLQSILIDSILNNFKKLYLCKKMEMHYFNHVLKFILSQCKKVSLTKGYLLNGRIKIQELSKMVEQDAQKKKYQLALKSSRQV
jgi:hypothetical protein